MIYPVAPTKFNDSIFDWSLYDRDYFFSPDGFGEMPTHHCKKTWIASEPFIASVKNAVDIGCRDGEYTRYLMKKFNHVFCFDYRKRKLFHKNVDLTKITHFQCALGEENKIIRVSGGGSIDSSSVPIEKWHDEQLYRLDDFNLPDIDYIKIDVDGFELRVLQGCEQTITKFKPILVIEQENNVSSSIDYCIQRFNYEVVAWDTDHRNVIMKVK